MSRRLTAAALATALAVVLTAFSAPARAASPSCVPGDCFTVDVTLDRAPAVGQSATLTVEVTAKQDIPAATTVIELPETLRWARPPAGLAHAPATIGRSHVDRASRTERARKGERVRYEGVVTAVAPGPASIRVRAGDGRPGPGSEGLAYLTIGAESSAFGMRRDRPSRPARTLAPETTLAADTCVHGRVTHIAADDGAVRGTPSVSVEVWDKDEGGTPDLLGQTATDATGGYTFCFPGADEDGSGQDVYLLVSTVAPLWTVAETDGGSGSDYFDYSEVKKDVPPGTGTTTIDYAASPGDDMEGAFRIMAAAYDTWDFYVRQLPQPSGDCWKPGEAACQRVTLVWRPDRVIESQYYFSGARRFQADLDASVHLSKMTVAHELGHFIMDYTHGYAAPDNCSPHYMATRSSESCAWVEGWADWLALQTYGGTHYQWKPSDGTIDLESPTWFSAGWDDGADVEGRVAGVLLDLADNREEYWDRGSMGTHGVVAAFRKAPANTLDQFLTGLEAEDQALAESVAFQNTIRSSRTEDLDDRTTVRRPANVPLQSVFSSITGRWSVVAAATSGAGSGDVTLEVDPFEGGSTVRSSQGIGPDPDFVAVQPTLIDQIFTSRVSSGVDLREYVLQSAAAPPGDLEKGTPQTFTMPADQLVEIRTTPIDLGAFVTFTVTPQNGQDVDLYVMAPNSAVWGLARSAARRSSTGGPGKAERITIADPKVPGVYAVIVVKKSGDGELTLTRT
ncbi:hypothetical protein [Microbispora triticiradicis]|uniref:hypothetical protein n=1 Tax=Microbispora triticiradicis TaxID=2200763 RepID=UPI001AD7559D|nr:hypothetical protein [Microbispora triticiradicis]MBO4272406.1 hypothetical protein [Microbispora triticiradicis]